MGTEKKSVPAAVYLACGAAIGAVMGLLFAPKKGSDLRADLGDFGREASRKIGVAKSASREALHDVREKMHAALKS